MLHIISIVTFWAGVTFSAGRYVYDYVEHHKSRGNGDRSEPAVGPVNTAPHSSGYRDSDSYIEASYRYEQE